MKDEAGFVASKHAMIIVYSRVICGRICWCI